MSALPPAAIPLFAIAPFIAAALSAAVAAVIIGPLDTGTGRLLSLLAAAMALLSFGPNKCLDAQLALIWPAVVTGQVAAVVIVVLVLSAMPARQNPAPDKLAPTPRTLPGYG